MIYLDPPYIQSLRKKNMYACEMTDKQHIEMLRLIKNSKSKNISKLKVIGNIHDNPELLEVKK